MGPIQRLCWVLTYGGTDNSWAPVPFKNRLGK